MTADLRQIIEGVLLVFAALFPIVNPLGGAPIFRRAPQSARSVSLVNVKTLAPYISGLGPRHLWAARLRQIFV
jgi:hypothetical protein